MALLALNASSGNPESGEPFYTSHKQQSLVGPFSKEAPSESSSPCRGVPDTCETTSVLADSCNTEYAAPADYSSSTGSSNKLTDGGSSATGSAAASCEHSSPPATSDPRESPADAFSSPSTPSGNAEFSWIGLEAAFSSGYYALSSSLCNSAASPALPYFSSAGASPTKQDSPGRSDSSPTTSALSFTAAALTELATSSPSPSPSNTPTTINSPRQDYSSGSLSCLETCATYSDLVDSLLLPRRLYGILRHLRLSIQSQMMQVKETEACRHRVCVVAVKPFENKRPVIATSTRRRSIRPHENCGSPFLAQGKSGARLKPLDRASASDLCDTLRWTDTADKYLTLSSPLLVPLNGNQDWPFSKGKKNVEVRRGFTNGGRLVQRFRAALGRLLHSDPNNRLEGNVFSSVVHQPELSGGRGGVVRAGEGNFCAGAQETATETAGYQGRGSNKKTGAVKLLFNRRRATQMQSSNRTPPLCGDSPCSERCAAMTRTGSSSSASSSSSLHFDQSPTVSCSSICSSNISSLSSSAQQILKWCSEGDVFDRSCDVFVLVSAFELIGSAEDRESHFVAMSRSATVPTSAPLGARRFQGATRRRTNAQRLSDVRLSLLRNFQTYLDGFVVYPLVLPVPSASRSGTATTRDLGLVLCKVAKELQADMLILGDGLAKNRTGCSTESHDGDYKDARSQLGAAKASYKWLQGCCWRFERHLGEGCASQPGESPTSPPLPCRKVGRGKARWLGSRSTLFRGPHFRKTDTSACTSATKKQRTLLHGTSSSCSCSSSSSSRVSTRNTHTSFDLYARRDSNEASRMGDDLSSTDEKASNTSSSNIADVVTKNAGCEVILVNTGPGHSCGGRTPTTDHMEACAEIEAEGFYGRTSTWNF